MLLWVLSPPFLGKKLVVEVNPPQAPSAFLQLRLDLPALMSYSAVAESTLHNTWSEVLNMWDSTMAMDGTSKTAGLWMLIPPNMIGLDPSPHWYMGLSENGNHTL